MSDLDLSRLYDDVLPEDSLPPIGWFLVEFVGGTHDGTRCWADRPGSTMQVTAGGTTYVRHSRTSPYYLAPGARPPDEPIADDQLSL